MITVNIKYKIPYAGKYNRMVSECPSCGHRPDDLFAHICGFNESRAGLLFVAECPKCFTKWSAHAGTDDSSFYYYFLDSVKDGKNVHFGKISPPEEA